MSKTKEKTLIRKALESISSGNATGLKTHIREALYSKVKKALAIKEKEIAKNLCERALSDAADLPHQQPRSGGVVAESFTLTQTDRLVVASIKRLLRTTDVTVLYNNTEYLARIPSSEKGKLHHLGITLEPSSKRLGKLNWVVYDQTISDQDPSSKQKLAKPEASLPFDQGDIPLSMRKLQELLQIVARNIAAGNYAAQEPSF